jgi:hypothetical protein
VPLPGWGEAAPKMPFFLNFVDRRPRRCGSGVGWGPLLRRSSCGFVDQCRAVSVVGWWPPKEMSSVFIRDYPWRMPCRGEAGAPEGGEPGSRRIGESAKAPVRRSPCPVLMEGRRLECRSLFGLRSPARARWSGRSRLGFVAGVYPEPFAHAGA